MIMSRSSVKGGNTGKYDFHWLYKAKKTSSWLMLLFCVGLSVSTFTGWNYYIVAKGMFTTTDEFDDQSPQHRQGAKQQQQQRRQQQQQQPQPRRKAARGGGKVQKKDLSLPSKDKEETTNNESAQTSAQEKEETDDAQTEAITSHDSITSPDTDSPDSPAQETKQKTKKPQQGTQTKQARKILKNSFLNADIDSDPIDGVGLACNMSSPRIVDEIQIHLIAWRRVDALQRLLNQLETADYSGWNTTTTVTTTGSRKSQSQTQTHSQIPIPLYLHIEGEPAEEVLQIANQFQWTHGPKIVDPQPKRVGLRSMWLDSLGKAASKAGDNTLMLVFEDDTVVSPLYVQWLLIHIDQYARYPSCRDSNLVGFSLSPLLYQEMYKPFAPWDADLAMQGSIKEDRHPAYLSAVPSSWGSAYWTDHWNEFDKFARKRIQPPFYDDEVENVKVKNYAQYEMSPSYLHIPNNARANVWPKSWKRFMIDFMYGRGLFMMYPNLKDKRGLATALQEDGEHIENTSNKKKKRKKNPRVADMAQTLAFYQTGDGVLPPYSDMVVFGLDHNQTTKLMLAKKGAEFLNDISLQCQSSECKDLLQVWGRPSLPNPHLTHAGVPVMCAADLYTSKGTMSRRPSSPSSSGATAEQYLLYEPQYGTNNQIQALLNAYAWAKLLGRRLVLPPLFPPRVSVYHNASEFDESEWINLPDFLHLNASSASLFKKYRTFFTLPSGDHDAEPIGWAEFKNLGLTPWRKLAVTRRAVFDDHSTLMATSLLGTDGAANLETVDLRSIFGGNDEDDPISIEKVQHYLGGCSDQVLMMDGLFFVKIHRLSAMNMLPRVLSLEKRAKAVIQTLKDELGAELETTEDQSYACYHVRQGDFAAMCATVEGNGKSDKDAVAVPQAFSKLAKKGKGKCFVTSDDLYAALQKHKLPALVLSDNPAALQDALEKYDLKSVTSEWISKKTEEVSHLKKKELELMSLLADQYLCAGASLAVLSSFSTVSRFIKEMRRVAGNETIFWRN